MAASLVLSYSMLASRKNNFHYAKNFSSPFSSFMITDKILKTLNLQDCKTEGKLNLPKVNVYLFIVNAFF